MLQPKKQKHRKMQKGRSRKRLVETRGIMLSYGNFGLRAMGASWMTANQIEAGRKAIAHSMNREGRLWIRIFPDKPVTKLPPEVTLGGGKGEVDHYVFPVKPGRIIYEVDGVSKTVAERALKMAGFKMPFKTKIISR
ncbi:MAG: 50S ribosomal protein L16 [Candidatus Paceibacterota bacterium]|jgi:large subunit ribosomal protein L16